MYGQEDFTKAEGQFIYADDLIKEKRTDEAKQILEEIVATYPSFGKAYNHLGWVYETRLGDLKRAEECYQACIRYTPEYRPAYYNYAVVLSSSKRYRDLENLLRDAQQVAGIDMGTIYSEYAIMYESQGYYEEAIKHYKKQISQLFNDDSINAAVKAIERCRKKQDIMNS
jgi:tetratricopeptide (TPR) repeat protein